MHKTVGLSMIHQGEGFPALERVTPFVDKVELLDTRGKFRTTPTKAILKKMQAIDPEVPSDLTIFDFATARNEAFALLDTDFILWLDTDDEVDLSDLRDQMKRMDDHGIDLVYWPYVYDRDQTGNVNQFHYRERLLRNDGSFIWKGMVHETLVPTGDDRRVKNAEPNVFHQITDDHRESSLKRNYYTNLYEYVRDGEETDPRVLQYLGGALMWRKNYELAVEVLLKHIDKSRSDDDIYRSWIKIADCYLLVGVPERAMFALSQAVQVHPDYPESYLRMAEVQTNLGEFEKALTYLQIGLKQPDPDTTAVVDPSLKRKAVALATLCYFQLSKIPEAYQTLQKAKELVPDFHLVKELDDPVTQSFMEGEYLKRVIWLAEYLNDTDKSQLKQLFRSIPAQMSMDDRVSRLKHTFLEPKTWGKDEIAYICGGVEPWSPDSVETGISGSEEAVIYLSKELSKLGWKVTVYNTIEEEQVFDGVVYKPLQELNPNDTFNVIIGWRNANFVAGLDAKRKLIDLHDCPLGHQYASSEVVDKIDKFMFKSNFQRSLGSSIPDEKCVVISNGISSHHFDMPIDLVDGKTSPSITRNPKKVIYASSPDRGLDCLLGLWPQIKEQVPEAELHWYYGWDNFDKFHSGSQGMMKWKWQMIKKINDVDCKDHGRIGHKDLAREFMTSSVWAYPTEFPEINCITALKAQAAGCTPITSGFAALQETVMDTEFDMGDGQENPGIYADEKLQKQFVDRVVYYLKNPESEDTRQLRAAKVLKEFSWEAVSKVWDDALRAT